MDHDDPVYAGQSYYTSPLLLVYDRVVHGFVSWFIWQCPTSGRWTPSNRRGAFDNLDDTEEGLHDILAALFKGVEFETIGSIAVVTARDPRSEVGSA
jgi:hypothetical protein